MTGSHNGDSRQACSPAVTCLGQEASDESGCRSKLVDDAGCRENDGVRGSLMIFPRKIISNEIALQIRPGLVVWGRRQPHKGKNNSSLARILNLTTG